MNRDLSETIAVEFNLPGLPGKGSWWTPQRASKAADIITETYQNANTRVVYLTRLRGWLRSIGATEDAIEATKRRDLTVARNATSAENLKSKTAKGIEVPEAFQSVDALCARIKDFLRQPHVNAYVLADFLVTFCARKNEALTLRLDGDQLVGALKQRGNNEKFDIVSCVPDDLCKQFMTAWAALDRDDISRAIRALERVCQKTYGCSVQNLREVGAFLASKQSQNEGTKLDTMKKALRHKRTNLSSPVENYATVKDPQQDIINALAETDPKDHDEILQFIKRRKL